MTQRTLTDRELRIAIERGFPSIVRTNIPIASVVIPYALPQWAVYTLLYHVVPVRPTR